MREAGRDCLALNRRKFSTTLFRGAVENVDNLARRAPFGRILPRNPRTTPWVGRGTRSNTEGALREAFSLTRALTGILFILFRNRSFVREHGPFNHPFGVHPGERASPTRQNPQRLKSQGEKGLFPTFRISLFRSLNPTIHGFRHPLNKMFKTLEIAISTSLSGFMNLTLRIHGFIESPDGKPYYGLGCFLDIEFP